MSAIAIVNEPAYRFDGRGERHASRKDLKWGSIGCRCMCVCVCVHVCVCVCACVWCVCVCVEMRGII